MGIYREEALLMLGMLGDIKVTVAILDYIEGGDDDEEEAEEAPDG